MFVVKFEYGLGSEGCTESCVGFDTMDEARKFALDVVNEICDQVQKGVKADNAVIRVWDGDVYDELLCDI